MSGLSSFAVNHPSEKNMVWILCKGNPEVILQKSSDIMLPNETWEKLTIQMKIHLE